MTTDHVAPLDPGTLHVSISKRLLASSPLLWAYDNDPPIREHIRQLNVVLTALAAVTVRDVELADQILDFPVILPTDAELVQRRYEADRLVRQTALRIPRPITHSEARQVLGRNRVGPSVEIPPCPECAAGKCQNCTGESMVLEVMVGCPCLHDGSGFLSGPVKVAARYCNRCDFYTDHVSTAHDGLAERGLLLSREDARTRVQS